MSEFTYKVTTEDEGKALKAIVKEQFAFSSRLMTKLRKGKLITVNGEDFPSWIPLKAGDIIKVDMPEERSEFPPENIPIDVVYEDEYILVVNKQPGLVVHPTKGKPNHTLLNGLMYKILSEAGELEAEETGAGESAAGKPAANADVSQPAEGSDAPARPPVYKIRLVNRLDMNTSGLMIVAKDAYCQNDLVHQMKTDSMEKRYLAIVEGILKDDCGSLITPIGIPDENEVERWLLPEDDGGQLSVTHFEVKERIASPHSMVFGTAETAGKGFPYEEKIIDGYTLVELRLETGRTHQIRVHMASMGHPVVGDHLYCHGDPFEYRRVYGDPRPPLTGEKGPRGDTNPEVVSEIIGRQALHAYCLEFRHPITEEKIHLETGLPDDMKAAILKAKEGC